MDYSAEQPTANESTQDSSSLPEAEHDHPTPMAKRQKTEHHHHQTTTATMTTTTSSSSILESLHLDHTPSTHTVHVAVFRDVENAEFLHQQLLARNAEFEYALIDGGVVTSRLQVLSAAFKAISAQVAGTLRTPNVHSEIVCALSPTKNISEAYRRHGITPTTRDLVVLKVLVTSPQPPPPPQVSGTEDTNSADSSPSGSSAQDVEKHLLAQVRGTPVPFTDEVLAGLTDWARVRKYYKLNGVGWLDAIGDQAAKNREMDMLVTTGMALRGV